jgi:hypothetical protein
MKAMVRLRFLLACLLMAALPLQGLAAVSMMLCSAPASKAITMSDAGHGHGHDAAASASHDHHAPAADPGMPNHAVHAHGAAPADDGAAASHECGICGAGCHSVAITSTVAAVHLSTLAQASVATPVPQVHTRTTPVPDRPPRA